MRRLRSFWREAEQRGLLSAIVVYAVVGFVVLLLADVLALVVTMPAWLHRLLIKTVLVGLPITALVAWSFDLRRDIRPVGGRDLNAIREEERSRTTSILKATGVVATVLTITLLLGAMFTSREHAPAVVAGRVLIAPFENRTDNRELEGLGPAAADWISRHLLDMRDFDIVPFDVATAYTSIAPPAATAPLYQRAIELARGVGAGMVVSGSYYLDHDSLKFAAQLFDARNGDLLRNIPVAGAPAYRTSDIIARFQQHIVRALVQETGRRPPGLLTTVAAPPAPRAYEHFSRAMQQYALQNYDSAAASFQRATAIDTSFVLARIWQARALADASNHHGADTLAHAIYSYRTRLTEYEKALLDYVQARSRYDMQAQYGAATKLLALAPASDDAIQLLATDALATGHPRQARSTLLAARPEHGWLRAWGGAYFATVALAYDYIGDYHDELRVAREGSLRFPESAENWLGICRALAAQHRVAEVFDAVMMLQTRFDYGSRLTPGSAFFYCAQDLASHGEGYAARRFIGQSFAWFKAHADRTLSPIARSDYANILALLHKRNEAYRMMLAITQEPLPGEVALLMRARLGFIAAATGRPAEARRISAELDESTETELTPYVELEQARTAALLNDDERAWNKLIQAIDDGLPYAEIGRVTLSADYAFPRLRKTRGFRLLLRPRG